MKLFPNGDCDRGTLYPLPVLDLCWSFFVFVKHSGGHVISGQNGSTCYFWTDLWGGHVLCQSYPELYSFVRNKRLSFSQAVRTEPLHCLFHLPLSQEAYAQYLLLEDRVGNHQRTDEANWRIYIWVPLFFPHKLIDTCSVIRTFIQPLGGYGNLVARTSIRSFPSSYSKTEWAPGTLLEGKTWPCIAIL